MVGLQFEYTRQKCEEERKELMWCGWLRAKITLYLPSCHLVMTHLQTIIYEELEIDSIDINPSKRHLAASDQEP